jgi:hypothetical protein
MRRTLWCLLLAVIMIGLFQTNVIEGSESVKEIDILPTPKKMEPTRKRFMLNDNEEPAAVIVMDKDDRTAIIAAQEINDRIRTLGGQPLPTITRSGNAARNAPGMNAIRLMAPAEVPSGDIPGEVWDAMNTVSSKGEQGYAIQFCKGQENGETAILVGAGWQGLLHASSTFRLLIDKEGGTIFATEEQIADWPDFKYRGLPVWPLPGSFDDFKKYVDWAFRYKFNRIYTYATRINAADGFNLPTSEERHYLRKINVYAKERGIRINYALTWAVATASPGGNKDEYQEAILFDNQYYTWGDDGLLRKRAAEIAQFARETEAGSLLFHCIDTYKEGWDKRRKNDLARFGDDRAAADANVINIFTTEIRRTNPGIELQFVVYPYHANFDLPGNERYKAWITKLSASIPHDVYLIVAELNRDQSDSWISAIKQPLVHWINGNAFQWGRYFSTLPAFTKTAYYDGRDRDVIIHWEPIGYFNGEVMQLVAAEYEWNINAPGSGRIVEERAGKISVGGAGLQYRKEMVNGQDVRSWAWFDGTNDPEPTSGDLLRKACRLEFGKSAAPFLADFFKNNVIGWRSPELFSRVLHETMAGEEWKACSDQLTKTQNALTSLEKALQADIEGATRARLSVLLKNTYHQSLVITGLTAYYKAMELSARNLNVEASQELKNGLQRLGDIKRELERQGIWTDETREWFEAGGSGLKIAEAGLNKGHSINRVKNPGFEEPRTVSAHAAIPSWSSVGAWDLIKDSHRGNYAARVSLTPSDSSVYLEQLIRLPANCNGFVEFWMKKDGNFRVIPIIQIWDKDHTKKMEDAAVDGFPYTSPVADYMIYQGRFHLPSHVTEAVFKIYADWQGFTPSNVKYIYIDDVFVGCDI